MDKIENILTGGYGTKEDLREIDKDLRENYSAELLELRHRWEKVYLEALEAGQNILGKNFKQAIQSLDRVISTIQRADYGYAALFDRTAKVREEALNHMLEYDKMLKTNIDSLKIAISSAESVAIEQSWVKLIAILDKVKENLREIEEKLKARETAINQD